MSKHSLFFMKGHFLPKNAFEGQKTFSRGLLLTPFEDLQIQFGDLPTPFEDLQTAFGDLLTHFRDLATTFMDFLIPLVYLPTPFGGWGQT